MRSLIIEQHCQQALKSGKAIGAQVILELSVNLNMINTKAVIALRSKKASLFDYSKKLALIWQ